MVYHNYLKRALLRKNVPRLRRISMSPYIDFDKAVENVQDWFIFAWKPSPAVLAESSAREIWREIGIKTFILTDIRL